MRGKHGIQKRVTRTNYPTKKVDFPKEPQIDDHTSEREEQSDNFSDRSGLSSDEDEIPPKYAAYNALLAAYGQSLELEEPKRKRRKLHGRGPVSHSSEDKVNGNRQKVQSDEEKAESQRSNSDSEDDPDAIRGADVSDDEEHGESDEGEDEISDPFQAHFANPDQLLLQGGIKSVSGLSWQTLKEPFGSTETCTMLWPTDAPLASSITKSTISAVQDMTLKQKLLEPAQDLLGELTDIEQSTAGRIANYQDLLFGARTVANADRLKSLVTLHALNHVFKTRDRILKNNSRLAKQPTNEDIEYRDQGFTRPRILILLPTRNACARYVNSIVELSKPEQQENKKRFQESYVDTNPNVPENSAEDYRELFGGNNDDMFRIGVKFTRKTIQFFSPFYNSDIIIASPLGLRRAIESPKPKGEDQKRHNIDYDFLSSIEILIVDQADALIMQNWDHVEFIFDHLNLQPREAHGCDFSRVRNWYLDNHAQYLRQTIVLSSFLTPELLTLFSKHMLNVFGKTRFAPRYTGEFAHLRLAGLDIKQTFSRFDSPSIAAEPDKRFEYFTSAVIPSLARFPKPPDGAHGILIFVPSYFDFVRLRNYFARAPAVTALSAGALHENAGPVDAALRRARTLFRSGRHSVLLYTGRAHHFFRYRIRGVKKVVFYGLPDNPLFYREIVGDYVSESINDGFIGMREASVRVLFSKYDALKLERIVGTSRVRSMLGEKNGDTFEIV